MLFFLNKCLRCNVFENGAKFRRYCKGQMLDLKNGQFSFDSEKKDEGNDEYQKWLVL